MFHVHMSVAAVSEVHVFEAPVSDVHMSLAAVSDVHVFEADQIK